VGAGEHDHAGFEDSSTDLQSGACAGLFYLRLV